MVKAPLKNQTYTHQALSEKSLSWAANKCTKAGNRGSIEVPIPGYGIADSLISQAIQYKYREHYQIPQGHDYANEKHIFVFESKVSYSDFMTIFPKLKQGVIPGNFNYIVCPVDLIKPDQLPDGWGMLQPKGSGMTEIIKPKYFEIPLIQRLEIESNILWYAVRKWDSKRVMITTCQECGKELIESK
jgi:hypothetical protein